MRSKLVAGAVGVLMIAGLAGTGTAVASAADAPTQAQSTRGLAAVGLTADGRSLVGFSTADPGRTTNPIPIAGLQGDTRIVGIDFRVQDGMVYGVGDRGGLYTTRQGSNQAAKVGQLSVPLEGTAFGVDFNPAANALRIVSNTGQNLRQSFAATPLPATAVDTPLNTPPAAGTTAGVTAAAYTNNDLNASTATTLFDLNTTGDQVVVQSPANSGQLAATGALGVDAVGDAGFDIYSSQQGGATVANQAFAVLQVGAERGLYRVDLLTGKATKVGAFRAPVADLAIALNQG